MNSFPAKGPTIFQSILYLDSKKILEKKFKHSEWLQINLYYNRDPEFVLQKSQGILNSMQKQKQCDKNKWKNVLFINAMHSSKTTSEGQFLSQTFRTQPSNCAPLRKRMDSSHINPASSSLPT